ncbi:MAG: GNAT family N-acetyltransferase [Bacteroidales bacterium]
MEKIIAPIDRKLLRKELTPDKLLRKTNKGNNNIYVVTHHNSPNVMLEIGRLRELTFRAAGGGTGKDADIDRFDTQSKPFKQLIVWDDSGAEILGGYRYIVCSEAPKDEEGERMLATNRLFKFSKKYIDEYEPLCIELGRSFVQPDYQSSKAGAKALFALDNLWDGLGALIVEHPQIKYFLGKMTMYRSFDEVALLYLMAFLDKYFRDKDGLIEAREDAKIHHDFESMTKEFTGNSYMEDYKILSKLVRGRGENIPPLVNAYMNLSPSMRVFGTVLNRFFGNVEETGILVTISDIYGVKKDRHIETYIKYSNEDIQLR